MPVSISIPDVCERDVDLLLLEEFVASKEFCKWFLQKVDICESCELSEAMRSVKTPNGESDLELTFNKAGGLLKVLIENKVDAVFQTNQPHRYQERAKEYTRTGKYSAIITVLVAPEAYFREEEDNYGFDVRVTYESVLDWFKSADHLRNRQIYKIKLLNDAIDRGRSGWILVPDSRIGEFWRFYWNLAEKVAPQLQMSPPKKEIPIGSHFIRFCPPILPPELSLLHKVRYGNVDLQFAGMSDKLADMERIYREYLIPPMRIEKAAQSAVIRMRVDRIDMTSPFEDSEAVARKALESALKLLEWYSNLPIDKRLPKQNDNGK